MFQKFFRWIIFVSKTRNSLFDDLAVLYGFNSPWMYNVRWSKFDNITQGHDALWEWPSLRLPRPAAWIVVGRSGARLFYRGSPRSTGETYVPSAGSGPSQEHARLKI